MTDRRADELDRPLHDPPGRGEGAPHSGATDADHGDDEDPHGGHTPFGADLPDRNLALLRDVRVPVTVELGRGRMCLREILHLGRGAVVELERLAGDPLDIRVGDEVIARGEALVLDENLCIRITQVLHTGELRQGA